MNEIATVAEIRKLMKANRDMAKGMSFGFFREEQCLNADKSWSLRYRLINEFGYTHEEAFGIM